MFQALEHLWFVTKDRDSVFEWPCQLGLWSDGCLAQRLWQSKSSRECRRKTGPFCQIISPIPKGWVDLKPVKECERESLAQGREGERSLTCVLFSHHSKNVARISWGTLPCEKMFEITMLRYQHKALLALCWLPQKKKFDLFLHNEKKKKNQHEKIFEID